MSEFQIGSFSNLAAAFFYQVEKSAIRPAQWVRIDGDYAPITYEKFGDRVRRFATGLMEAGVKPGDRIALLMENRPEWAVIDFAILSVGAVTVPLYCSYRPQDMAFVLNDAGARMVVTSGGQLLEHLKKAIVDCEDVETVYAIDVDEPDDRIHPLAELKSDEADGPRLERRLSKIDRDQLATLVYTSGTTSNPKGVMLSHGNIMTNLEAVLDVLDVSASDCMLSFLPLAHVLERTGGHFMPFTFGISVAYAERPDTVAKNLAEARPTIMATVPRMLEVVQSRILQQVSKQSSLKQKLFYAYFEQARKRKATSQGGWMFRILDRLVAAKVRERFGGRLRVLIAGGAPLGVEVGEFFELLGIPVMEGYGLSESSPLLSINPIGNRRIGTVGPAARGVEIRIADDGEILARGANIMSGYWKNRKATRETLVDGWLHTGDIGEFDEHGYLKITDRKKDIIVNSGGENVAPQRIESILAAEPMIDQAIVYGDQRPYLVAIIIPNREACQAWAEKEGMPKSGWAELASSEVLRKHLQGRIQGCLKPLNPHEQIRRISVQTEPFTVENGFMTPTMKLKRRLIYHHFESIFDSLY